MTIIERMTGLKLLEDTVGICIKILSNNYQEIPGADDQVSSYHTITFQIEEEEPVEECMRLCKSIHERSQECA